MAKRRTDEKPIVSGISEKITLRLPEKYLRMIDFLVELDDFPSRSEAIRAAVRDMVYGRIELVQEKTKRMADAEHALASLNALKRDYVHR